MNTINICLNDELVDQLVVSELQNLYETNLKILKEFDAKESLRKFEIEDQRWALRVKVASRTLLEHYLTKEDADKYFRSIM